jgi:hypothetical protein
MNNTRILRQPLVLVTIALLVPIAPVRAFNNDTKTDILWRNQVNGQDTVWLMGGPNGATYQSSASIPANTNLNWKIVGTGDFDSDGQLDILWRNSSTGQNAVWFMNGTNYLSSANLTTVSDTTWDIVGTGYFNADGCVDILWRQRTTGANVIWFMNGITQIGSTYIQGQSDLNWKIVGTGDFNNDGKCDILWRHATTGQNAVWYMNSTACTSQGCAWYVSSATIQTVADVNWEIAGSGYFDADNKIDILWRHRAGGGNVIWFMNGITQNGSTYIADPGDNNWKIVGTGDSKVDCDADLLTNLAEYQLGSNPTVSNSKNAAVSDAKYFKVAANNSTTKAQLTGISFQGDNVVLTLTWAEPDVPYDMTWTPDLNQPRRLLYSGPADGNATGATRTYTVPCPNVPTAFFEGGDARDSDGDGLPDWYEANVTLTGVNNPDSDTQNPASPNRGNNGVNDGDEDFDGDGLDNAAEYTLGTDPFQPSDISVVTGLTPGLVLSGFPSIQVDAAGPRPLIGASLFVDGKEVDSDATDLTADYFYLGVDTTLFPNGNHKVTTVVHDDAESGTTGSDDPVNPTDAAVAYGGSTVTVQFNNFLSNAKVEPDCFPESSTQNAQIVGTFSSARNWQVDIAPAWDPSFLYRSFSGSGSTISASWDLKDGFGQPVPAGLMLVRYRDGGPVGGPPINPPANLVTRPLKNKVLGRFAALGQGHHGASAPLGQWPLPSGVGGMQPGNPPWPNINSVRTIAKDLNQLCPKKGIYPAPGYANSFLINDSVTASMFKPPINGGSDYLNKGDLALYVGHSAVSANKLFPYDNYMPFIPIFTKSTGARQWVGMHEMSLGSTTLKWAAFYSCNWLRDDATILARTPGVTPKGVIPGLLQSANGLCMNNALHILHSFGTEMTVHSGFGKQWMKALTQQTAHPANHTMLGAWRFICRRTQPRETPSTRNRALSLFWAECQNDYFIGYGPNTPTVQHPSGFLQLQKNYEWADANEPQ